MPERYESQPKFAAKQNNRARTPEYYLQAIEPQLRDSFTAQQLAAIQTMLTAAIAKPTPKLVDLRFDVDLIISRFYVVLLVGKDRRRQKRPYLPEPMSRLGNVIAAALLLIGLNLLISFVILLFAYLVKSAVGIDFFHPGILLTSLKNYSEATQAKGIASSAFGS